MNPFHSDLIAGRDSKSIVLITIAAGVAGVAVGKLIAVVRVRRARRSSNAHLRPNN